MPTATNAKRIARCRQHQHLAHKAGQYVWFIGQSYF